MKKISLLMPHSFWLSVKVSIFFSGLFLVWMLLKPGSHDLFVAGDVLALPVSLIIGMLISFGGKPRWWHRSGIALKDATGTPQFWQPLIFLVMCINHLIAQVITIYLTFQLSMDVPHVSWADFFFLTSYPLTVGFFLLLPTRPLASLERARVVLNTLILMITAATFTWYFLVGPILFQSKGDLVSRLVTCAYPLGDLMFFFCLLQLTTRTIDARIRPGIFLLVLATLILMFLDSTIEYRTLNNTYVLGTMLDICMPLVYLCYGLAVHALRMGQVNALYGTRAYQQDGAPAKEVAVVSFAWISFLPYILLPVVIGLTFYVLLQGRTDLLAWGVYVGGLLLIVCILTRQITLIHAVTVYARVTAQLNKELHDANGRLEAQATTDPLTGLPNHRALQAALTAELERAQRYQRSCTLLFIDLDHFKALNDGYGHATGDEVLIAFGQRLAHCVRGIDTVGRWGGEEFIVILAETTMDEAQEIAERIHRMVSQQPFAISGGLHLTCSIGIASYPAHATGLNVLINAADQAMYAAKRLGRNQHRMIDDPAVRLILASGISEEGREGEALHSIVTTLAALLQQHNAALGEHSKAVADLAEQIALRLGISALEAHMIHVAGQLHDLGKIGVPDAILQKTAQLSADEWEQIKRHPVIGSEIIANIPALRALIPAIRAHHERWNGTGYPDQLCGEHIPRAARIIAVADAYLVMVMDRPYKQAYSSAKAVNELRRCSGTQFDVLVVEALVTLLDERAPLERQVSVSRV